MFEVGTRVYIKRTCDPRFSVHTVSRIMANGNFLVSGKGRQQYRPCGYATGDCHDIVRELDDARLVVLEAARDVWLRSVAFEMAAKSLGKLHRNVEISPDQLNAIEILVAELVKL